jgi:hypothetical protein
MGEDQSKECAVIKQKKGQKRSEQRAIRSARTRVQQFEPLEQTRVSLKSVVVVKSSRRVSPGGGGYRQAYLKVAHETPKRRQKTRQAGGYEKEGYAQFAT